MTWMPLLSVTLPIVIAILGAAWLQNKRIDSLERRIETGDAFLTKRIDSLETSLGQRIESGDDSLNKRVDDLRAEIMPVLRDMQASLKNLDRRVTVLEERLSPIMPG